MGTGTGTQRCRNCAKSGVEWIPRATRSKPEVDDGRTLRQASGRTHPGAKSTPEAPPAGAVGRGAALHRRLAKVGPCRACPGSPSGPSPRAHRPVWLPNASRRRRPAKAGVAQRRSSLEGVDQDGWGPRGGGLERRNRCAQDRPARFCTDTPIPRRVEVELALHAVARRRRLYLARQAAAKLGDSAAPPAGGTMPASWRRSGAGGGGGFVAPARSRLIRREIRQPGRGRGGAASWARDSLHGEVRRCPSAPMGGRMRPAGLASVRRSMAGFGVGAAGSPGLLGLGMPALAASAAIWQD